MASANALEVRGQNSIGIFSKITGNEAARSGVGTLRGNRDHRGSASVNRFRLTAPFFAVQDVNITSSDTDNFAVSFSITTLASSQTEEFTVTFALKGNGVVANKPRSTVLGGSQPQILGSDGTAAPTLASGTVFPDTFPRALSTKTFTIRNDGDGDLTFPQPPDAGAPFAIVNSASFDTSTPLSPGQTRSFDVAYQPTAPAPFSNATVRVSSNDPDTSNYFFRVRGSSTAPTTPSPLEITGDTNFGTIVEFTPSPPRIFTVTNIGSEEYTIDQISIPFADAFLTQEFEPTKIGAGEQIEFPIWLNSENINGGRRYTTTVSVRVTEPKFATATLDLVAMVIEAPAPPTILSASRQGTELVLSIALGETSYRVERSDNMVTWAPVPGLDGQTTTELRIQDAATVRFFRLIAEF